MNRTGVRALVPLILAVSLLFAGCGGGGGGGEASVASIPSRPASVPAGAPPQPYENSTPLDPSRDLDYYEFYIRDDLKFTDTDLPVAQVAACTDILSPDGKSYVPNLTTLFELDNLLPFLPPSPRSYLSIRAVGVDGQKSGFSTPIAWDHT